MRRVLAMLTPLIAATLAAGCASVAEVKGDQDRIRHALNDLYTNQVIDNLIRAANGLPFVQVDYTNATSTVTITENGSLGGNQQVNTTEPLNPAARLAAVARGVMNTWNYSAGAMNSNQIAVTANPVITNPEIYDAYLEFLTLPGSLRVTCEPPPDGAAHLFRKWQGKYYWVPAEYRSEFLRLALLTTAQRGRRLLPAPDSFAVALTGIAGQIADDFSARTGTVRLRIKLDQQVPNDTGHVDFTAGGKPISFPVEPYAPPGSPRPYMTGEIVVIFNPKTSPDLNSFEAFQAALPASAKLYLNHARPDSPPTTDQLLQAVRFQLEQIRFNQLRP